MEYIPLYNTYVHVRFEKGAKNLYTLSFVDRVFGSRVVMWIQKDQTAYLKLHKPTLGQYLLFQLNCTWITGCLFKWNENVGKWIHFHLHSIFAINEVCCAVAKTVFHHCYGPPNRSHMKLLIFLYPCQKWEVLTELALLGKADGLEK